MKILHIDLETYSGTDLKKAGGYRYAADPSFRVLLFGYSWQDEKSVNVIDMEHGEQLPRVVRDAVCNPRIQKVAHNANFERVCLSRHFGEPVPAEEWRCTAAWARSLALPGSLGKLGEVLGLPLDAAKDKKGTKLIRKFCTPGRKQTDLFSEAWLDFIEYCRQDITAEKAVFDYLSRYPLPASEWELWALDQRINDRGIPVDTGLSRQIQNIEHDLRELLEKRIKKITGVSNPNSRDQLRAWLESQCVSAPDLTAATVQNLLSGPTEEGEIREVLKARQQLARSSLAKLAALERAEVDGRMKGAFLFHGANTGRWVGKLFQPQNLPRPIIKQSEIPAAREIVQETDAETWAILYDDPMGALSSLVRSVIAPKTGLISVADLSSIESVMAAWIAGSEYLLELFRSGRDPYKDFASKIYDTPYDKITKKQRNMMKPCVLGRQYGMGAAGLSRYAEAMGILLPEQTAKEHIKIWNQNHGEIIAAWKDIQDACLNAIESPGKNFEACRCTFHRDPVFLIVGLPCNRRLCYRDAQKVQGSYGPEVAYKDAYRGWIRTFGARMFENIVQAVSRDVLACGMAHANKAGLEIFGHVHDEVMVEGAHLPQLIKAMTTPPDWCLDAPIKAEGYESTFYRKD